MTGLIVPLTQPTWVKVATLVLLIIAALALVISSLWLEWPAWLAVSLALIPFLVHFLGNWRGQQGLKGRVLVVLPDQAWQLAFFSEANGLTDRIEVTVKARWHHFFGLSLGLKLQHCPHNIPDTFVAVVWRTCMSESVFHQVALLSARQIGRRDWHTKGNAV